MTRLEQNSPAPNSAIEKGAEAVDPLAKASSKMPVSDEMMREARNDPTLIARGGPTLEQLTSSYNTSVNLMNAQGQRFGNHPIVAWVGNILQNTGIRPEVKVCAEQSAFVGERMKGQFGSGVKVELVFLGNYDHTVLRITPAGGKPLYADPWGGQPPTPNFNKIYMHEKGISGTSVIPDM